MARRNALIMAVALLAASAIVIAAAPAQPDHSVTNKAARAEPESDEHIVADFLSRKERAEKAQRAIILSLRKGLDRKRAEFEDDRKKLDEARNRYAEVVGPLARQGVTSPDDPRLPYEFDVQRSRPESSGGSESGYVSRKGAASGTGSPR